MGTQFRDVLSLSLSRQTMERALLEKLVIYIYLCFLYVFEILIFYGGSGGLVSLRRRHQLLGTTNQQSSSITRLACPRLMALLGACY